jgi:hypothetical protein
MGSESVQLFGENLSFQKLFSLNAKKSGKNQFLRSVFRFSPAHVEENTLWNHRRPEVGHPSGASER